MAWVCQKCGACCRSFAVETIVPEYWDKEKKRCKYIGEDNLCEIYENRPMKCRTQKDAPEELVSLCCKILRTLVYRRNNAWISMDSFSDWYSLPFTTTGCRR